MKQGYHSVQKKYYNSIPRSVFLGLALGYAVGMFVTGFLRMDGYVLEIVGAVIGFAGGWWVDRRFYLEKDEPETNESEIYESEINEFEKNEFEINDLEINGLEINEQS